MITKGWHWSPSVRVHWSSCDGGTLISNEVITKCWHWSPSVRVHWSSWQCLQCVYVGCKECIDPMGSFVAGEPDCMGHSCWACNRPSEKGGKLHNLLGCLPGMEIDFKGKKLNLGKSWKIHFQNFCNICFFLSWNIVQKCVRMTALSLLPAHASNSKWLCSQLRDQDGR